MRYVSPPRRLLLLYYPTKTTATKTRRCWPALMHWWTEQFYAWEGSFADAYLDTLAPNADTIAERSEVHEVVSEAGVVGPVGNSSCLPAGTGRVKYVSPPTGRTNKVGQLHDAGGISCVPEVRKRKRVVRTVPLASTQEVASAGVTTTARHNHTERKRVDRINQLYDEVRACLTTLRLQTR